MLGLHFCFCTFCVLPMKHGSAVCAAASIIVLPIPTHAFSCFQIERFSSKRRHLIRTLCLLTSSSSSLIIVITFFQRCMSYIHLLFVSDVKKYELPKTRTPTSTSVSMCSSNSKLLCGAFRLCLNPYGSCPIGQGKEKVTFI